MELSALIESMPGYATATAHEKLAWLEADTDVPGRVGSGALLSVVTKFDLESIWEDARTDATVVANGVTRRSLAKSALRILERGEGLDLADPGIAPMLDLMQAAAPPLLPGDSRAALEAAGLTRGPRWQLASDVSGLREVREHFFNADGSVKQ